MSQQAPAPVTLIDNPTLLSIYANVLAGIEFDGANFSLLFAHQRVTGTDQATGNAQRHAHIVSRLTLPAVAAADLVNKLTGIMKQISELQQAQPAIPQAAN